MKYFLMMLFVLSQASFAKEVLQPNVVAKLSEQKLLDKLRVYLSNRSVVVREFNRQSNTDVNGGNVTTSLKRVIEKTIITRSVKGKIVDASNSNFLYVSFDPKCTVAACAYKFEYQANYTQGYGLAEIPNVEGSEVIDAYKGLVNGAKDRPDNNYYAKRVKLLFSERELNDTIKRTVRPPGFDVQ